MFRFITPVDAAVFTGITGIVMVLTGREIGGAIVLSASLGAFIFFEWYLSRPGKPTESEEYRSMMHAAEQWEKAIREREKRLDEREKALKHPPLYRGEVDIYCPPEYRDETN